MLLPAEIYGAAENIDITVWGVWVLVASTFLYCLDDKAQRQQERSAVARLAAAVVEVEVGEVKSCDAL